MIKIIRFKKGFKSTLGELYIDNKFFCFTLEREWLDNEKYISCIPAGKYSCKPYSSPKIKGVIKYKNVTEITNIPNRDKILVHAGNYYLDTLGCILVGDSYKEKVKARGEDTVAVYNSKTTLKRFFDKVGRDFELEIFDNINFKIKSTNLSIKPKNKMIVFPLAVSLVKLFAPSIINRFKRAGKNLAENTAKELIKKAEKKLGFKITDEESAEKARDQLDSKDLLELEKTALKTSMRMFIAELKFGEKLGGLNFKDEWVVLFVIGYVCYITKKAFEDPTLTLSVIEVIKTLFSTPFGIVFIVACISAVGGKSLLYKVVDKFIK